MNCPFDMFMSFLPVFPHQHLVGRLIGKQGRYVSFLKQNSGAKIYISTLPYTQEFQICHIEGEWESETIELNVLDHCCFELHLKLWLVFLSRYAAAGWQSPVLDWEEVQRSGLDQPICTSASPAHIAITSHDLLGKGGLSGCSVPPLLKWTDFFFFF